MNHFQRLNPLFKSYMEEKGGPAGVACTVVRRGEVLYEESFGYANLEKQIKIQPDTIYRIYSMTKVITCLAALKLFEKGLFLLNDPLDEYLPEFKNPQVYRKDDKGTQYISPAANPIRIRDLFTMTSGITYGGNGSETERQTAKAMENVSNMDLRSLSKALAAIPLDFDPGTRWKYALSHDVLAALIEVLSGQTFGAFLKKEIFEPLGMKDTSFQIGEDKRDRLCVMYDRAEDGTLTPNTSMDAPYQPGYRYESGGGGLLSTMGDYSRFAQALAKGGQLDGVQIIGQKTLQLMATNHLNAQQIKDYYNWHHVKGYGYGLGVRVMIDPATGGLNSTIGEYGWSGLAGSWLLVDPKEELSVVYMQQMLPSLEPYITTRLRAVVYGALQ